MNAHREPFVGPIRAMTSTEAALTEPDRAYSEQTYVSTSRDLEAIRVQDDLARLRHDAEARRTFYDDLLGTVKHVRADTQADTWGASFAEETPDSHQTTARTSGAASNHSITPTHSPAANELQKEPPVNPPRATNVLRIVRQSH